MVIEDRLQIGPAHSECGGGYWFFRSRPLDV